MMAEFFKNFTVLDFEVIPTFQILLGANPEIIVLDKKLVQFF